METKADRVRDGPRRQVCISKDSPELAERFELVYGVPSSFWKSTANGGASPCSSAGTWEPWLTMRPDRTLKIVKTDTCRTVCIRARGESREQQKRTRQNHEQTKRQTAPRTCLKFSHGSSQDLKNHAVFNNSRRHGKTFFCFFGVERGAARSTRWSRGCGTALPPDICAFGDYWHRLRQEADPPSAATFGGGLGLWWHACFRSAPTRQGTSKIGSPHLGARENITAFRNCGAFLRRNEDTGAPRRNQVSAAMLRQNLHRPPSSGHDY